MVVKISSTMIDALQILSTLTENGIPAEMATLEYEYTAPKLLLAEGSHCTEAGTFVVYDGAILYKCVEEAPAVRRRGKRAAGSSTTAISTTATTEMPTTGEDTTTNSEFTTEPPTTTNANTTPDESTTPGAELTTKLPTTANPKTTLEHKTTTESSPETNVKAEQFQIVGAVVVETQQPIFESQWNLLAAEIQAKLEKHRVLFTEDIRVELV
ncbi:hypothetical protein Y032_0269g836 [Ancylostoma ceylanicum]|nr:hypothetical protein Y032_0269g836 [Ancylostoma ceylanicum]